MISWWSLRCGGKVRGGVRIKVRVRVRIRIKVKVRVRLRVRSRVRLMVRVRIKDRQIPFQSQNQKGTTVVVGRMATI